MYVRREAGEDLEKRRPANLPAPAPVCTLDRRNPFLRDELRKRCLYICTDLSDLPVGSGNDPKVSLPVPLRSFPLPSPSDHQIDSSSSRFNFTSWSSDPSIAPRRSRPNFYPRSAAPKPQPPGISETFTRQRNPLNFSADNTYYPAKSVDDNLPTQITRGHLLPPEESINPTPLLINLQTLSLPSIVHSSENENENENPSSFSCLKARAHRITSHRSAAEASKATTSIPTHCVSLLSLLTGSLPYRRQRRSNRLTRR